MMILKQCRISYNIQHKINTNLHKDLLDLEPNPQTDLFPYRKQPDLFEPLVVRRLSSNHLHGKNEMPVHQMSDIPVTKFQYKRKEISSNSHYL